MTVDPGGLAPQRAKLLTSKFEAEGHLLEPDWVGRRALVRIGMGAPHFVGYGGVAIDGPEDLYREIVEEASCDRAVIDGVIIDDWKDEAELEIDRQGYDVRRPRSTRRVFVAFDLLEIDGESLLDAPLLERKRHLEGMVGPRHSLKSTPFVTRNLAAWGDTLKEQGFHRAVIKDPNSPYSPGQTTGAWLLVERFGTK